MMAVMKRLLTILPPVIALAAGLVACQRALPPTPSASPQPTVESFSPTAEPTQTPTIEPTSTSSPTPSPSLTPTTPPPPKLNYVLWAELDYATKFLAVNQFISIPNNSSTTLNEIVLVIPANLYKDTFYLSLLAWENGQEITEYEIYGSQLVISLQEPLNPGMIKNILLSYELRLPPNNTSAAVGPNPFGYTTRQVNLVDWYPFVPPYRDGEGWLVNDPWAYGEFLVYPIANFDVTITFKNLPQAVTVAASAPDIGDEETHKYILEDGRNFVWSVSPLYEFIEDEVNGTTIAGYIFSPDREAGKSAFNATVDAFKLYTDLFGPYPHLMLTMVEADFDHGMEYQSLYFLNRGFFSSFEGTSSSFLVNIAAHETSHQWWYGLVANNQAMEPWLDEALATYSEYLFYEHYYPEVLQEFWWDRRVNPNMPSGWVNSTIYSTTGYREYRDAVYLQGAKFFVELRELMGDEAFFAFLKDYAASYTNQIVTGNDFFRTLAKYLTADINELLNTYFVR
jgi:hypothetical protein